jgi:hypothetical protein
MFRPVPAPAASAVAGPARPLRLPGGEGTLAVLVALAGAGLLAALAAPIRHEPTPRGDELIYERMASHPGAVHTFPFAYRVAVPWLVHVLPFSHQASFDLLAYVCAGGAGAFLLLLMRRLGLGLWASIALALAFALSPPMLVACLRQGRNPDPSTMLVIAAGAWLIASRRPRALCLTLLLGALVRESTIFLAPLAYACWARRPLDGEALRRVAWVSAPMLAAYLALRIGIPTTGRAQVPGYSGSLLGERLTTLHHGLQVGVFKQARRIVSIFGPLWLLAPPAIATTRFGRRGLVLAAGSLLSMSFALDWGRMVLLSAPLMYGAGALTLRRHPRLLAPTLLAWLVLILGYAIYMNHSGVLHGIIENPPPPYPTV